MKSLIIDLSPVVYRWVFASTSVFAKKNKKQDNGLYELDEYKDIVIYQIINYLSNQKMRFGVDEIIIANDVKPYWRNNIWSGYKYGRLKDDKSGINWVKVSEIQKEIAEVLYKYSSFKTISIPGAEADDVGFVLSEYLSKKGHEVILHTPDHDWTQNIIHENVKVWETKYSSPTKSCGYVTIKNHEIKELQQDHAIYGDKGDYVLNINSYTQFSDKFKEIYPNVTELQVYPKRHFVDIKFEETNNKINSEDDLVAEIQDDPVIVKSEEITDNASDDDNVIDIQADGGTHVKNLKEVPKIEIIKLENKGKNNRRVYFKFKE